MAIRALLVAGICALAVSLFTAQARAGEFTLRAHCPSGFQLNERNQCLLRNMYQLYDSLQQKGVGGTQTGLPPHRDGFSPQQIDLGRYLFFDPILSGDNRISCASCHQTDKGLSDGLAQSVGIGGHQVSRSAPTLWNVAFLNRFFWDARAQSLEEQMLGPLYSSEEMGNTPDQLLFSLNNNSEYLALFAAAFDGTGQEADSITLEQIYAAITAFQTSLISLNSRYDRYAHGYHSALSKEEQQGLNVYRSFVARCAECHTPPLFTNQQIAVIGTPEPEGQALDIGAERTFGASELKAGFKVPTLRNIEKTAPYMHSGRFKTLREVVEFYTNGRGHAVPEGVNLQLHWHIWEPNLGDAEIDLIVEFLKTLTDETFMPSVPAQLPSGLSPVQGSVSSHQSKVTARSSGENYE